MTLWAQGPAGQNVILDRISRHGCAGLQACAPLWEAATERKRVLILSDDAGGIGPSRQAQDSNVPKVSTLSGFWKIWKGRKKGADLGGIETRPFFESVTRPKLI
jgi:hypothetical protein